MRGHLTSAEISRWMAGDGGVAAEEHLHDCADCRAEVARFERVLAQFRSSVHHTAEGSNAPRLLPRTHSTVGVATRWVLAAAALVLLVTAPFYQSARERRRAMEQAEADTVLMERVDRAVSRSVPRPMEPLIELVGWGSNPTEGNTKKQ